MLSVNMTPIKVANKTASCSNISTARTSYGSADKETI